MKMQYKKYCRVLVFALTLTITAMAQVKKMNYSIIQGNGQVGTLTLVKKDSAGITQLQMESAASKRILFAITIYEKQQTILQNGHIKYSMVLRKVNGNIKSNKSIQFKEGHYVLLKNGKETVTPFSALKQNQLTMYYEKPADSSEIYSDQFERKIPVKKIKEGEYKIDLPDGNTNYYSYKNGILTRLKLKHTFFSAEFILKSIE